ncbi:MAG: phage tail tape measure protein, partial [Desulfobacteraceae bacterium 4572_19]
MTGSFSLGTLTAYLGADTTQFKKELMQASALMQNTGKQMTAVGKQMSMSLTAPLVAAGAVFTKVSADFEKSLNQVKAVSGATDAQMEQLANQARDLGKSTKFSAKEVADGMSFLSMAGFSVQETMDALASTLHLASAGNMELAESADIVSNIMQGFGKSADKTAEVVDILTKTFTTSNTNLSQLGLAMSYVAPVAKA